MNFEDVEDRDGEHYRHFDKQSGLIHVPSRPL